jgi:hypothetical protein
MAKQKRKLTDEVLVGSADHLYYEVEMLRETTKAMAKGGSLPRVIKNALLESFIIHMRGLISFAYDSPEHPDDVVASDYFDEGEWAELRSAMTGLIDESLKRANKEVAHITTFRVGKTLDQKQWRFLEIAVDVFSLLRLFFDHVRPSRMPAGYRGWYEKAELHIVNIAAVTNTVGRST